MELLFKLTDVAFFVAVGFVTIAALIVAVQCNAKRGNSIGAWVLFLGCLIGGIVSFGHVILSFLPGELLYSSGPEFSLTIVTILSLVNLVSTLVMVIGVALFRPFDAAITESAGGQ